MTLTALVETPRTVRECELPSDLEPDEIVCRVSFGSPCAGEFVDDQETASSEFVLGLRTLDGRCATLFHLDSDGTSQHVARVGTSLTIAQRVAEKLEGPDHPAPPYRAAG